MVKLVNAAEFKTYRSEMKKSQLRLAQLLGVSLKAIQGYEQGWRNIPPSIERQVLFLVYHLRIPSGERKTCWEAKSCAHQKRSKCPAYEFKVGNLCWFVNGTLCDGKPQQSWKEKIQICRKCEMFKLLL
jgi:DNA-binding XRE family transcriptional regulator